MCDPLTAVLSAVVGGASLLGASKKQAPPPAPAVAQAQPINTAAATPTVKVGPEDNDPNKAAFKATTGLVAQRKAGTALGGLGKSSLDL